MHITNQPASYLNTVGTTAPARGRASMPLASGPSTADTAREAGRTTSPKIRTLREMTPVALADLTTSTGPALTGAPSAGAMSPLEELFSQWGGGGSSDLNSDGVVDGADLGLLLADEPAGGGTASGGVDDILDNWGGNSAAQDLNGDGTVDGADLGIALGGGGVSEGAGGGSGVSGENADVQSLMDAWGSDNSQFDLNGDGTVDGADLGLMLGGTDAAVDGAEEETGADALTSQVGEVSKRLANAILVARDGDKDGALTAAEAPALAQLVGADADSFGVKEIAEALEKHLEHAVDTDPKADLNALAKRLYDALAGQAPAERDASHLGRLREARSAFGLDTAPGAGAAEQRRLDSIVDSMRQRLDERGFGNEPPANLRTVVDGLGLGASASAYILRQLTAGLPTGLGVSAEA